MKFRIWMVSLSLLTVALIVFKFHHGAPAPVASVTPPAPAPSAVNTTHVVRAPAPTAPVEDFAAEPQNTNDGIAIVNTNNPIEVADPLAARMELMAKLRDLAETNFDAALQQVQQMTDGDEKDDAMQAICYGLARRDPARAVQEAETLQQPDAVKENLVQQWAGKDVPAAMVWANNQPASDARNEVFQRIGYVLSQSDPRDAANLVVEQIPAGAAQDEAVMSVLHQWANKDMMGAVNWVKTFPDSPFRERALQELEGIESYQKALANQSH